MNYCYYIMNRINEKFNNINKFIISKIIKFFFLFNFTSNAFKIIINYSFNLNKKNNIKKVILELVNQIYYQDLQKMNLILNQKQQ